MGIKINTLAGDNRGPIGLGFRPPNTINGEMLLDLMFSVAQSNASYSIEDTLEISITTLKPPYGGAIGRLSIKYLRDHEI